MPHHNLVTLIDLRHRHRRRLVHIRPVAVHAHSEIHLDPPDGDPSTRQSDFCRKMCRRVKVLGEDAVARRRGTAAVRFLLHHGAMRLHFVDDLREPLGAVGLHGNARRREIFSSLSDLNGGQLERAPELQNHVQDLGQEKRTNNSRKVIGSTSRASRKVPNNVSETSRRSSPDTKNTTGKFDISWMCQPPMPISDGAIMASHPPSKAPMHHPTALTVFHTATLFARSSARTVSKM